jgi:hypothetical protein
VGGSALKCVACLLPALSGDSTEALDAALSGSTLRVGSRGPDFDPHISAVMSSQAQFDEIQELDRERTREIAGSASRAASPEKRTAYEVRASLLLCWYADSTQDELEHERMRLQELREFRARLVSEQQAWREERAKGRPPSATRPQSAAGSAVNAVQVLKSTSLRDVTAGSVPPSDV